MRRAIGLAALALLGLALSAGILGRPPAGRYHFEATPLPTAPRGPTAEEEAGAGPVVTPGPPRAPRPAAGGNKPTRPPRTVARPLRSVAAPATSPAPAATPGPPAPTPGVRHQVSETRGQTPGVRDRRQTEGVIHQASDALPAGGQGEPAPQDLGEAPSTPEAVAPTPAPRPPAEPVLTAPRPLHTPLPDYPGFRITVQPGAGPPSALPARTEGRVRVRLLVLADGTVGSVDVLVSSGDPDLDRATAEALRGWRFEPARRDGVPTDSYYVLWVSFTAGP